MRHIPLFLALAACPPALSAATHPLVSHVEVETRFADGRTPDPVALVGRWKPVLQLLPGRSLAAYAPEGLCPGQDCHALEFERQPDSQNIFNMYSWMDMTLAVNARPRTPESWTYNGNRGSLYDLERTGLYHPDLFSHLQGENAIIVNYRRVIAQYSERDSRGWGKPDDSVKEGFCRMAGDLLLCRVFIVRYVHRIPSGAPYHMHWRYETAYFLGYHKERSGAAPPAQRYIDPAPF